MTEDDVDIILRRECSWIMIFCLLLYIISPGLSAVITGSSTGILHHRWFVFRRVISNLSSLAKQYQAVDVSATAYQTVEGALLIQSEYMIISNWWHHCLISMFLFRIILLNDLLVHRSSALYRYWNKELPESRDCIT